MIAKKMQNMVANSSAIRAMFEEGNRLAKIYGKENVFDFSLGNPNVPAPDAVKKAIIEILDEENPVTLHGYTNSNAGYPEVRQAVAESLNARFGTAFAENNIVMTVGAAGGLNVALKILLNPGDEVITFAPYFGEYRSYTANFDGVLVVVSPNTETFQPKLDEFAEKYGYSMTAEDFINKGNLHVTHMPGNQKKSDWMAFINDFVVTYGKKLIDMVHEYGKKAYVFYDDSWVGVEPWGERFKEFGFDGLIKCVFSGYEARLCAGVDIPTHELRLHPYLFPVGLGGAPTFMEGGNPTLDAKKYWNSVRRALLREKIDRIGLGGYLSLTLPFPDFNDYIAKVADEFRLVRSFHDAGKPYAIKTKVAVLHYWGKLRSWTLSGHFHETYMHDLIHVNEALSGLPIDVKFISFEDVKNGALDNVDVVINAGRAGTAWSGGDAWKDDELVTILTKWVHDGGTFLGVNEPSAVEGYDYTFRMAHVLGIDLDTGAKVCHGKWSYEVDDTEELLPAGATVEGKDNLFLTDGKAKVLMADVDNRPLVTVNEFGKGKGIYLASFQQDLENTRMLYHLIRYAGGEGTSGVYMTDNLYTECAYYPENKKLVIINNSDVEQTTTVPTEKGDVTVTIAPYDTTFVEM